MPGARDASAMLLRDEGVSRLIRALALSDRFHLFLASCTTPRVADALFPVLVEQVSAERGERVRLVRLDAYAGRRERGPMTFERVAGTVLTGLVAPAEEDRAPQVILAVDASKALPEDDAAWNLLFQRMNERRNVIAAALRGPLLVVMPPRLEPAFAHAAPDFWSIRSFSVVIGASLPADGWLSLLPDRAAVASSEERSTADLEDSAAAEEGEEIEQGIAAARAQLATTPDDPVAMSALGVWLERSVAHELEYGAVDRAIVLARENVALRRSLLTKDLQGTERLRDVALALAWLGDALAEGGDLGGAVEAHGESVDIARRLDRLEPGRTDRLHLLLAGLRRLGDVHRVRGDWGRVRQAATEGVQLARRMVERGAWSRRLVAMLDLLGDVERAEGHLEEALGCYEEGLEIARERLRQSPGDADRLRDLELCLEKVGRCHQSLGGLDAARQAFEEALGLARRLVEKDPARRLYLHDLAMSVQNLGDLHLVRGDMGRARDAYDESLQVARRLSREEGRGPPGSSSSVGGRAS